MSDTRKLEIPRTAKAVYVRRFGNPLGVVDLCDVVVPDPGEGQVLVQMIASPINPSDLLTIAGTYSARVRLPFTPGYEGVGIVVRLGAGVHDLRAGTKVLPLQGAGTWQEFTLAPARRCVAVLDGIPDSMGCQLYINPMTAWLIFRRVLNLAPGDTVVANACASNFGLFCIQLARVLGIRLLCLVEGHAQAERVRRAGATEVIDTSRQAPAGVLPRVLQDRPIRAALDAIGGSVGGELVQVLATGGALIHYGLLSGEGLRVDQRVVSQKELEVRPFWLRTWARSSSDDEWQSEFRALMTVVARHGITLPLHEQFPVVAAAEAVRASLQRNRQGKVVLAMKSASHNPPGAW